VSWNHHHFCHQFFFFSFLSLFGAMQTYTKNRRTSLQASSHNIPLDGMEPWVGPILNPFIEGLKKPFREEKERWYWRGKVVVASAVAIGAIIGFAGGVSCQAWLPQITPFGGSSSTSGEK
jgi:hypothetical protein